jgi:hypothetical protein
MSWAQVGLAVGGAYLDRQAAKRANKNARIASARQMAFQERMSSSSYQRGMEDMRLAGLNPILAGKMGGASTPSGAQYTPVKETPGLAIQQAATVQNIMAQTKKTEAETKILNTTGGASAPKTVEGFKRLIENYTDGLTSSVKQKLQNAIDRNNAMKAKKASGKNKNKNKKNNRGTKRITITPNRYTNEKIR